MAFRTLTDDVLIDGDNIRSFKADGAISKGQHVDITGDNQVGPVDGDGEMGYGFALYDAESGDAVAVAGPGCKVRATSGTGSISAGDFVTSHGATGEEGELASVANDEPAIGQAAADDVADGGDVIVLVEHIGFTQTA